MIEVQSILFYFFLNYLYENNSAFNNKLLNGYRLKKIKLVRDLFIKQAMGRVNLTD